MALLSYDPKLVELLKTLGMPDHCVKFTLIVEAGSAVTAEATYYPTLDLNEDGKLVKLVKRYRLVELEDEPEGITFDTFGMAVR